MGLSCWAGTWRVQRFLLSGLIAGVLSACGGGGDGSDGGTGAQDDPEQATPTDDENASLGVETLRGRGGSEYFPIGTNDQWVYRTGDGGLLKFKVTGRERVGELNTSVVTHNVPGFAPFEQVNFVADSRAVRQVPGPTANPVLQALGPLDVMRFPLVPGQRFVQVDRTVDSGVDIDGDGRTDALTVRSEVSVVAFELLSRVDAGVFARTAHLRTRIEQTLVASSTGARTTLNATVDDWYAPGIGLIRSRGVYREGDAVQSSSQNLLAYRIGSRRSDLVPPTVTAMDPAPRSLQGSRTIVNVDFSEPLDADALVPASVSVTDANGSTVFGNISLTGSRLTFVPFEPWPSGVYTVRLGTGLVDLAGNALRPRSWSFTVEAEAPTAVSLSPARDADDVALDAVLRAQFSEALDASTVPGHVHLIDLSSGAEVPATVTLADPRTITVRPQAALQRATRYIVQFDPAITDRHGNPLMMSQAWIFSTDPGLFGYPALVRPHFAPEAVAVGDVNHDGLDDVVMSTYLSFDAENDFKLVVYLQRPDGTLAEPVRYANASYSDCKTSSLAIADLDGDGRKDIALAQGGCGVEIFLQRPDGTLASGNWLPYAESHRVRAADLNGDGLADLVGMSAETGQVATWYQVGGRISLPTFYPAGATGGSVFTAGDLDVGDLNGDGRPDIVLSSPSGDPARSISVLYQQADGRYGSPLALSVDGSWAARGVALGDLNGDGRGDLAVTWGGAAPAALSVYYQRSDGTLAPPVTLTSLDYPGAIEIADLNQDGRLDAVVAHDGWSTVGVYSQAADGSLQAEQRFAGTDGSANPHGLAVGDLNGDGRPDIAQAGVSVLYNRGTPTVAAATERRMSVSAGAPKLRWWLGVGGRAASQPQPRGSTR
jgi:hypothetical protein